MAVTLISTPEYNINRSEPCRWLATESPNNFRLLRRDWLCANPVNNGGYLQVTVSEDYTGTDNNSISIYNAFNDTILIGIITNIDPGLRDLTTDILYIATMNPTYLNDNTLHGGYYFEGRLTINDALYPLTIIASPDTFGYADLDVSGILRIVTSLGKVGNYTARIMKEITKSGKFNFEYRECWYGSSNYWEGVSITSPLVSPAILVNWYYGEAIRSEEQGSNLHDYVPDDLNDAPFLNQFEQPVYFLGLPFDLSFIFPERALVSPTAEVTVNIRVYDSNNTLLSDLTETVQADQLEGYINSLNISYLSIPENASYITAEITAP